MATAPARKVVLVLEDASVPPGTVLPLEPYDQLIGFARYEDAEVPFDFYRQDRSAAPIPIGGALQLTVRREYYDTATALISVLATITSAVGGALCGYFPIPLTLLAALEVAEYGYDVYYIAPSGARWQVLPWSPFVVLPSPGAPDVPVTPGSSAPPLGLSTVSFRYTVVQPGDGADFTVAIPAAAQFPSAAYGVSIQLATEGLFASFVAPVADRAIDSLRVLSSGELGDGTVLEIALAALVGA